MSAPPEHLATGKPADAGDFILYRRLRLARRHHGTWGGILLDFGCGNGAQTSMFRPHVDQVWGLDIDPGFLRAFDALHPDDPGWRSVRYDGHRVPLEDACADIVTSFEVLEHVTDEAGALDEMTRLLRPGGTLILSVPNRWWIFETHGARLPLLPWNRMPFFSWLPKSLHDRWAHARNYRRREIVAKLRDRGFEIQHASYITAPMDVVRWKFLRDLLRATLARPDETKIPLMATAVLVVASKPG